MKSIFYLLVSMLLGFSISVQAIDLPDAPRPINLPVSLCGPFEIWNRTNPIKRPDGEYNIEISRVWAKLAEKEYDLRETSTLRLSEETHTVGCRVTEERTMTPLNAEGDYLSVVTTCGLFVPSPIAPGFLREQVFYVFSRQGEILKRGLCKERPPRT